jgi:hypothetical protein
MNANTDAIRKLNDQLRRDFRQGVAVMTSGVMALGADAIERIIQTVATFDEFDEGNDPYRERDFGSFGVDGETVFFKISYYDKRLEMHSPDPTDPTVTTRVLTIMLAEEY